MQKELYIKLNGKYVLFNKTMCSKCKYRYYVNCPMCNWNKHGKYDTYTGYFLTKEEANILNRGDNIGK